MVAFGTYESVVISTSFADLQIGCLLLLSESVIVCVFALMFSMELRGLGGESLLSKVRQHPVMMIIA